MGLITAGTGNIGPGTLSSSLAVGTTTVNSAALANLLAISGSDYVYARIGPEGPNAEVVKITAHTASATSATIEREQFGTTTAPSGDPNWAAGTEFDIAVITSEHLTVGGGGSTWALITSHNFGSTAQASLEFDLTGYSEAHILGHGISSTALIQLQMSPDGGSTWRTTAANYTRHQSEINDNDTIANFYALTNIAGFYGGYGGGSAPARIESWLRFFNLSTVPTAHEYWHFNSGPNLAVGRSYYNNSTEAHNRARLLTVGSVNITAGIVYVMGR